MAAVGGFAGKHAGRLVVLAKVDDILREVVGKAFGVERSLAKLYNKVAGQHLFENRFDTMPKVLGKGSFRFDIHLLPEIKEMVYRAVPFSNLVAGTADDGLVNVLLGLTHGVV